MSEENRRALVVVDVQPTFCEGGELGVDGGNAVAQRIADYVAAHRGRYAFVATTQDWHVDPGDHFSDHPDFVDSWPPHGLAGSSNAGLHPALADLLRAAGVGTVDVVGIAESHCVKATALDAHRLGLPTRVLTDLTVPVSPELGAAAREELAADGVELVPSSAA